MAWSSHGRDNADLVDALKRNGLVKSDRVAAAMKKVDRGNYVLVKREAYDDSPSPIDYGATISAPHMHAYAAEHLLALCKPGARVLDIGSGSGYTCAIFYHLVTDTLSPSVTPTAASASEQAVVVGIDHIPELVEFSISNLQKDGLGTEISQGKIKMIRGDGRLGYPSQAPYDVIHVGAAAPGPLPPETLIDQLARPGRMFIPVSQGAQGWGGDLQDVWEVNKDEIGEVTMKKLFGVRYVPLTDRDKQW